MRRLSAVLVFLIIAPAFGQDYPKLEVFAGYSRVSATILDESFSGNGGLGSIAINATPWLGGVGEFGIYHSSQKQGVLPNSSATNETFLFGPRVTARRNDRLTPFAHALFGGMHLGNVQFGAQGVSSAAFAMAFGGGVDFKLNNAIAFRPIQVDLLRSHFHGTSTTDNWQNSARVSLGLVFRMGEQVSK